MRWFLPGCIDDPRHGTLVPNAIADLLSLPETQVRLARLDPDGSIAQDPNRYRPNRALRRRIKSRDGGCRFPGCHASTTDVDHVIVFPVGRTVFSNLICLCRTHHLFKHHGGWSPVLARDGTVTWTAPDGRVWVTEPRPHQIREDLHLTNGVDANVMHDLRQGWFPGLPQGLDIEQLCEIERRLPDEPPEPLHTPEAPSDWEALDSREGIEGIPPACSPLERQLARELALAA